MKEVKINTEYIKLDSFLKWCGECSTGAEAKSYVLEGQVLVNGEVELRRGKKIYKNDVVEFKEIEYLVV